MRAAGSQTVSKSGTESDPWKTSPSACVEGRCEGVLGRQGGTAGLQPAGMLPEDVLALLRLVSQTGLPKGVEVQKPHFLLGWSKRRFLGFSGNLS